MDIGWLDTHYSFSFADYYDSRFMGFGHIRVINDDYIAASGGFPTHPHRDMEIFSFVTEGRLAHKDSTGAEGEVSLGRIQMMTAGSGIRHSEFNPSRTERTHLHQIWIVPRSKALTPQYRELTYNPEEARNTLKLLISPDRSQGSLEINQQTWVYESKLDAGQELSLPGDSGTLGWLQVVEGGKLTTGGHEVSKGDGVAYESGPLPVRAIEETHFLYFLMGR
jgi:redox-sensitive bicupin YhaK (pirin superfamily)